MGLGDIVRTAQPTPVVVWRKKKAGETIVAGNPASFDASGDCQTALDTHDGPLGMFTTLSETIGATTYYQILIFGVGIMKAGGAIKPNKFVSVSSASKIVATNTTVSGTYNQSEIQALWRVLGYYLGLESDFANTTTGDKAMSDAADTNNIAVFVGRTP